MDVPLLRRCLAAESAFFDEESNLAVDLVVVDLSIRTNGGVAPKDFYPLDVADGLRCGTNRIPHRVRERTAGAAYKLDDLDYATRFLVCHVSSLDRDLSMAYPCFRVGNLGRFTSWTCAGSLISSGR